MVCGSFDVMPIHADLQCSDCRFDSRTVRNKCATIERELYPLPRKTQCLVSCFCHTHGHCSQEIRGIIPVSLRRVIPLEARLIHTLSKFHLLIHELYPTNHHSAQEHAIYGTCCLLLAFPSPTTCHLSNLRSINSI